MADWYDRAWILCTRDKAGKAVACYGENGKVIIYPTKKRAIEDAAAHEEPLRVAVAITEKL